MEIIVLGDSFLGNSDFWEKTKVGKRVFWESCIGKRALGKTTFGKKRVGKSDGEPVVVFRTRTVPVMLGRP